MAVSKDKVRANLVINIELKKELEEIAKEEQRSFNNLVNKILSEYVKDLKENKEEVNELEKLIGSKAKSISSLGPTGFVLIDGVKYNAISYDGYLDNGLDLKVIAVKGRYLIVDREVK